MEEEADKENNENGASDDEDAGSSEKAFLCWTCARSFSRKFCLVRHLKHVERKSQPSLVARSAVPLSAAVLNFCDI